MSLSLRWIGHPAAWVVLCAAVLAMAPTCAVAREFRVADNQPADYPTVQALEFMANLVKERTSRRHWIRVFHSGQLGEEEQTLQQTHAGVIDIVRTTVAPMGSLVPAAKVLSLPFLFRSFEHLHHVVDGSLGNEILASFGPYGFVGLTFYDAGARSIYAVARVSSARPSSAIGKERPSVLARLTTSAAHCGTTALALSFEKSGGTSNLPVCRSYLQRQPFTTPVCMGLRVLMSASPERPMRRYRFSGQSTPSQR